MAGKCQWGIPLTYARENGITYESLSALTGVSIPRLRRAFSGSQVFNLDAAQLVIDHYGDVGNHLVDLCKQSRSKYLRSHRGDVDVIIRKPAPQIIVDEEEDTNLYFWEDWILKFERPKGKAIL